MKDVDLSIRDEKVRFQRAKDSIRVMLAQISPAYDPDVFNKQSLVVVKNPEKQADKIVKIIDHACKVGTDILLFPELVAPFSHLQTFEDTILKSKKDIVVCIPYEHTSLKDLMSVLSEEEIELHECVAEADEKRVVNFCRIVMNNGAQLKTFTQIKLTPFSVEFSLAASDTLVCGKVVHRFMTNWGNFLFLICKDYVGEIGTEKKIPMFDFLKSLTQRGLHYVFVSSLNPEPEAFLHAARSFYYMQEKSNNTFTLFLNIAELDNTTVVFPTRPHPGIRPTRKLELLPLFAGKPGWGTQLKFSGCEERLISGTFVRLDKYKPMATKEIYSPIHHTELVDLSELGIESELVELPKGVAPKERKKEQVRHNLPAQPTPFLGREKELTEIAERLESSSCRLLTLLGSGGMGKTRLGIQASSKMIEKMKHGVYFVPLAPLSSGDFIISTIANSLGFSFRGSEDQKIQLLNYLREKELLLVMDNFEHLIEKTGLLAEILEAASEVKILATSRERLNLKGEWIFNVHGMECPENEGVDTVEECDAVKLFLEGAQRVRPDFSLSEEEMPNIVRICRLVEGMPLAIELASAWMSVLSSKEVIDEIEQNIDFLTTSMKDIPERHKSMRAVFEHSWDLLSDGEKNVFMKMSVFRGGFSRDAAKKVTQASLLLLSALVDKSLLQHYPSGRFAVHELLRQYAEEKLREVPQEKDKVQDHHCEFYTEFLHLREELLKGEKQLEVLEEIGEEFENVRAAWLRAVEHGEEKAIAKSLQSLWRFYMIRGWYQEGEETFSRAAENLKEQGRVDEAGEEKKSLYGTILTRCGLFSYQLGHYTDAGDFFEKSLDIFRKLDARKEIADTLCDLSRVTAVMGEYPKAKKLLQESISIFKGLGCRTGMAAPLTTLGNIAYRCGQFKEAKQYYQKSFTIYKEMEDRWGTATSLMNLGNIAHELGENIEAKRLYEESLSVSRELGDRRGIASTLNNLGNVANDLGEYTEAKQLYQESLEIKREIGDRRGFATSLSNLGNVALALGQYKEAKEYHQEALKIYKDIGYRWGMISVLNSLASGSCDIGEFHECKKYFHEALDTAMQISAVPLALDALTGIASILTREEEKERALELLTFVLCHPASYIHTKNKAEGLRSKLVTQLAPHVVSTVEERGKSKKLEEVAEEILKEEKA